MKKEITLQDVFLFITENCDDTNAMDKINKMTFPFTSSYTYRKSKTQVNTDSTGKPLNWSNEEWKELITHKYN